MKKHFLLSFLIIGIVAFSCKKKTDEPDEVEFNKSSLLANVSAQIIVPRYVALETAIAELKTVWDTFESSSTAQNLSNVQEKWLAASISFQRAKTFNFGPALDLGLKSSFGTYPTDTSKILTNANASSPNLGSLSNIDAVGFPALEFLFFRNDALNHLTTEPELSQYVGLIFNKMQNEISMVVNAWNTGYTTTFNNGTGTEVTSGFSLLVNVFNQDFELAKTAKLGIPIGQQSLGIAQIEYEEAPFANQSLRLLDESLKSLSNLYKGISETGTDGIGFADYLIALDKSGIDATVNAKFSLAASQLTGLSNDLAYEVQNNISAVNDLYTTLQSTVVSIKTDMTSAFGVLVTYQDNDGD